MHRTLIALLLSASLAGAASFSGSMRLGGNIEFSLNAAALAGTNQISLSSEVPWNMVGRGYLVVQPYHTNCEIVKAASASGALVTLTANTYYAHTNGTLVFWFEGGDVPLPWFGAVGDGSTDDSYPLLRSLRASAALGLRIEGMNKLYGQKFPLVAPNGANWFHLNPRALSGYGPNETNCFMFVNSQGNVYTFTGATDDVLTTASAHGIPADGSGVVFYSDGQTLPTGIRQGAFYYATNRTALTFKVYDTNGTIVDITGAGGGLAYFEVNSLSKVYLEDVFFDGQNVVSNAVRGYLQQPTKWEKVRVDNVGGTAFSFKGQQADIRNLQVYGAARAFHFENASFFYIFGMNAEHFSEAGISTESPGLLSSIIVGSHFEDCGSNATVVIGTNGFINSQMHNVSLSGFDTTNRSWLGFDMDGGGYALSGVRYPQATPDNPNAIALRDRSMNKLIYTWRDFTNSCNGQMALFVGGKAPTSYTYSGEYSGQTIAANDGKEFRAGMGNFNQPVASYQAGTNQTAPTVIFRNGAGLPVLTIGTDGVLYFTNQSGGARVFWNGTNAGF